MMPLALAGRSGFLPKTANIAPGRCLRTLVRSTQEHDHVWSRPVSTESMSSPVPLAQFSPLRRSLVQWPTDEALSRLYEELVATALQVSLTTAIAIGLAEKAPGLHREMIGRYLPSRPSVLPIIVGELATASGGGEISRSLVRFDGGLARAKAEATELGAQVSDDRDEGRVRDLASNWRLLAAQLRDTLAIIAEFRPTACGSALGGMARVALAQLESVVAGEAPFLDRNGRLVVPLVAERRERARATVSKHVYISAADSIQRVLITDVATRGIGVWGLRGVAVGDKVCIMLAPGKEIAAEVVWFEHMRAGLKLAESDIAGSPVVREVVLGADILEH